MLEKGWFGGWAKKISKNKKNPDLWKRFIPVYKKNKVKFHIFANFCKKMSPARQVSDQTLQTVAQKMTSLETWLSRRKD